MGDLAMQLKTQKQQERELEIVQEMIDIQNNMRHANITHFTLYSLNQRLWTNMKPFSPLKVIERLPLLRNVK